MGERERLLVTVLWLNHEGECEGGGGRIRREKREQDHSRQKVKHK